MGGTCGIDGCLAPAGLNDNNRRNNTYERHSTRGGAGRNDNGATRCAPGWFVCQPYGLNGNDNSRVTGNGFRVRACA